jgi:hypothetical protein
MPSKSMVRLSNIIFLSGILFSLLVIVYYLNLYVVSYTLDISLSQILERNWYKYIIFIAACLFLLIFGLWLRPGAKVALSKWLLASFITLYVCEYFLYSSLNMVNTVYLGSLKADGVDAYANLGASAFTAGNGLKTKKGNRIVPLGGISNKVTVVSDRHYYSDRYGFNNMERGEVYSQSLEIVVLGTCFEEFQGLPSPSKDNLGEILRKTGYKAVNLSKAGSNFLSKFAVLREYAAPFKPKVTLFFYHTDDALFNSEKFSHKASHDEPPPIISRYLNENMFTQNLILKQNQIDRLMMEFVKSKEREKAEINWRSGTRLSRFFTLSNIRSKIKWGTSLRHNNILPVSKDFIKVLKKTKKLVSNWNGEVYLVRNVDVFSSYIVASNYMIESDRKFKRIQRLADTLGIGVIDLREEVFNRHSEPLSLFEFRETGGYPNREFYKLSAGVISKRLRKDG